MQARVLHSNKYDTLLLTSTEKQKKILSAQKYNIIINIIIIIT